MISKVLIIPELQVYKSPFVCRFKTGITLRFPRLEAVRNDKMWYECLDLNELARLKSVRTVTELVALLTISKKSDNTRKFTLNLDVSVKYTLYIETGIGNITN